MWRQREGSYQQAKEKLPEETYIPKNCKINFQYLSRPVYGTDSCVN